MSTLPDQTRPHTSTDARNRAERRHPTTGPLVHSVSQAAARLGCGRSHAYALVASGELPARQFAGRLVILDADLVSYIESLPAAELG